MKIFVIHGNHDYYGIANVADTLADARRTLVGWVQEGEVEEIDLRVPWRALSEKLDELTEGGKWRHYGIAVFERGPTGAWDQKPGEEDADMDMILDAEGAKQAVAEAEAAGALIATGGKDKPWGLKWPYEGGYATQVEAAVAWLAFRAEEEDEAEKAA